MDEARYGVLHCRNNGRKGRTFQRNRRERPVCRSAPERTELFPIIPENVPPFCHSDRSVSGVEESTTWDDEPPQEKACNLSRFLDSHSFARNDMSGGGSGCPHGLYSGRPPERHKALSVTCGDSSPKGRAKIAFSICFPFAPIVPTMRNVLQLLILPQRKTPRGE